MTVGESFQRHPTWEPTQYSVGAGQYGPWDRSIYEGTSSRNFIAAPKAVYDSVSPTSLNPLSVTSLPPPIGHAPTGLLLSSALLLLFLPMNSNVELHQTWGT
jgi:hypothetical protein